VKLRDTVMLITGASGGFGAATARLCGAAGARLILSARSAVALDELAASIRRAGGEAVALPADVTRDGDVARLVEAALVRFGRIDVLVNNAGFGLLNSTASAPVSELEAMLAVNLVGAARCARAVLPAMLAQRRGQIVNVSSLAGLLAMPNLGYYGATKAGLIALTRGMQQDLAGTGVRAVAVIPGAARTPFFRRAGIEKLPRTSLLLPWLSDEQVAQAIVGAVERDSEGEIILPAVAHPLMRLANAAPALARLVVRFFK
jgi:short-subunit dehydrogenase